MGFHARLFSRNRCYSGKHPPDWQRVLNGTVGNVAAMQAQYPFVESISPFAAFFSSIYNWLMLVVLLIWIFAGVNRKKKNTVK